MFPARTSPKPKTPDYSLYFDIKKGLQTGGLFFINYYFSKERLTNVLKIIHHPLQRQQLSFLRFQLHHRFLLRR